jgi:CRISPR system Cascade subunit CasE
MSPPYIVRAKLRRDVPAVAVARLLVPSDPNERMDAAHRVIWALFADGPDRARDFLWRETRPGEYLALSARKPVDEHGLFHLEHKPFAPALRAGQRLRFDLRANPAVSSRPDSSHTRGRRHDAVMHALHDVPPAERPAEREAKTGAAAADWFAKQGERNGFEPDPARFIVDGYDQVRLPRGPGAKPIAFSVLTLGGVLTVREPALFLARIAQGFGRAKAFGCGLMLIRPAYEEDAEIAAADDLA